MGKLKAILPSLNCIAWLETKYVIENYNWTPSTDSPVIIVDVGGSHGDVAIPLARKYPNVTCIVQISPKLSPLQ